MWFHRPARVDDWILVDLEPERASDHRGTYSGRLRTADGALVAVIGQECLLRPLPPG
jgi:acyl-CoA thioesterase-2